MADFLNMMEALRATRDPDSCLRGLNQFRKGLRGEEGPAFLARYLRQSPECQEMQAVWDTQLTVRHKHAAAGGAAAGRRCRHWQLLPPGSRQVEALTRAPVIERLVAREQAAAGWSASAVATHESR